MGDEITPDAIAAQASGPTLGFFARSGLGNPSRRKRNIVRLRSYHPIESAEAAVALPPGPRSRNGGFCRRIGPLPASNGVGLGNHWLPSEDFVDIDRVIAINCR